jgi:hypothetical protein
MNQQCMTVQICPTKTSNNLNLEISIVKPNSIAKNGCDIKTVCNDNIDSNIYNEMQKIVSNVPSMSPSQTTRLSNAPSMSPSQTNRSNIPINKPFPLSSTLSGCGNSKMFPCELYSAPSATVCPGYTINTKINQLSLTGTAECIVTPPSSSVPQCNETQRIVKRDTQFVCMPKNAI